MDKFKSFNKEKNFSILHLNIASLLSKLAEVNEIIDLRLFDLISFDETKIDAILRTHLIRFITMLLGVIEMVVVVVS